MEKVQDIITWINVKDKKPKKGQWVLASKEDWVTDACFDGSRFILRDTDILTGVEAWAELPRSYKALTSE